MPLSRDYLEGMISPPIVVPEIADLQNVRVEQSAYRDAQKMIGLTVAERQSLAAEQVHPNIEEMTTPAGEVAAKQSAADAAIHEGEMGNETVGEVVVTPALDTIDLSEAETTQLTAAVYSDEGRPITRTPVWTSSDETKATVSSSGLVTPVAAGTATITATVDGETDTCAITVVA